MNDREKVTGNKRQAVGTGAAISTEAERASLAQAIDEQRTGIVLSGRIVNGKVELDRSSLDRIASRFADAEISFVAVNAPFDPLTA
ncbi:hypothetical protein [Longimicrobium terrae]|uniref:Uncharacterized protein n=1 Tax=Longimicrobium terrae TaxID=1639882 RepID=A0A841H0C0_9BACT|nr:hypothetical protein [Longimicrobium terrae]MBB4636974.1 hypothetical protein [Longimicrobium terrae]MBB6071418.1 hypothetical protein [Longimicrobium terrae]NNC31361.1 hypothetical protein [Longimicrobium terrae]